MGPQSRPVPVRRGLVGQGRDLSLEASREHSKTFCTRHSRHCRRRFQHFAADNEAEVASLNNIETNLIRHQLNTTEIAIWRGILRSYAVFITRLWSVLCRLLILNYLSVMSMISEN